MTIWQKYKLAGAEILYNLCELIHWIMVFLMVPWSMNQYGQYKFSTIFSKGAARIFVRNLNTMFPGGKEH